jgi:putative ABC transport system permease protein
MTLASITFGVAALILAGGFIEDTIVETGESMIRSSTGHVQVSRVGYWQYGAQNPEKYLMQAPEKLRADLLATPGVEDAMLRLNFSGLLGNGRTDWSIVGEGIEPLRENRLSSYITLVAGRRLASTDFFKRKNQACTRTGSSHPRKNCRSGGNFCRPPSGYLEKARLKSSH